MTVALCILLCALGHLVRDGFPATSSTQLARFVGGFYCLGGALILSPDLAGASLGCAIYAGFYADQQHARGQGAAQPSDAAWLCLSGVTSLAPLALASAFFFGPWYGTLVLAGLLKAPIWFAWWTIRGRRSSGWAQPTRLAAMTFGAVVGMLLAVTA